MSEITNREQVMKHILRYGSITTWEAITNIRETRCAARINDLKKEGFTFWAVWETNNGKRYKRWGLEQSENNAKLLKLYGYRV